MLIALIVLAVGLHGAFAVLEMFPWEYPKLLQIVSKDLPLINYVPEVDQINPKQEKFTEPQLKLVATIVHNAGIYNAALAFGFLWALVRSGTPNNEVALVLFAAAALAGLFGTVTMKSIFTAIQALVGIAGIFIVGSSIS